jgi:Protein kinase domain
LHQPNSSFIFSSDEFNLMNKEGLDEYVDDEDPGFDMYAVNEENFVASCKELAQLNNFPARAIRPDTKD